MGKNYLGPAPSNSNDVITKQYTDNLDSGDPTPSGLIIMWSGATPPDGWYLCDGTNGTPDLRDRFLVGAGGQYAVGATGDGTMPSHTHDGYSHSHSIPSHTHTGPSHTHTITNHRHASPGHTHSFSATSSTCSTHRHSLPGSAYYGSGGYWCVGTGGGTSATVTVESTGSHTHSFSGTTVASGSGNTGSWSGTTGSAGTLATGAWSGSTDLGGAGSTLSAGSGTKVIATYYALAFIMKG